MISFESEQQPIDTRINLELVTMATTIWQWALQAATRGSVSLCA